MRNDGGGGPPFFLSYAPATEGQAGTVVASGGGQHVEEFFKNLAVNVRRPISLEAGIPAGSWTRNCEGACTGPMNYYVR